MDAKRIGTGAGAPSSAPLSVVPGERVRRNDRAPVDPQDLVIRTQLSVPQRAPWFTSRRRLLAMLDAGRQLPLILVSAAAGTGKTALIADWITSRGETGAAGWVTLSATHEELWPLILTCMQRHGIEVPAMPAGTASGLEPAALISLGATLSLQPRPLTIVLDGYELASIRTTEDLDFLLRCSAGGLRLVIVTRVDLPIRLYRYRLEGSLLEVRDRDLAFDDSEAGILLEASGLRLRQESVHDLNVRTKGWATGLRFAAQALSGLTDPEAAVGEVVATTSDINEYLLGEVLDAQSREVRELLLITSVPDTLYPSLVEEIAERGRVLSSLTKLNPFLEPVPGAPGCYRYYPFFRDLLRAELAYESPDDLARIQERTGRWFVRQGLLDAGVEHLVRAGRWETAATAVVESMAIERLLVCRDDDPLVRAFDAMPAQPPGSNSCLVRAALALGKGHRAECDKVVAVAREAVEPPGPDPKFAVSVALVDALRARDEHDPAEAERLARRAQRALEELGDPVLDEHPELVVLARTCRGVAQIRGGRLAEASRTLVGSASTATDESPERQQALGYLALVEAVEGRLSQAADNAGLAIEASTESPTRGVLQSTAGEVALAVVSLERCDIDAAESHVRTATSGDDADSVCRGFAAIAEAGVQHAKGHPERALAVLTAVRATLPETDRWLDGRLGVELARLQIASGAAVGALQDLSPVASVDPEASVVIAQAHLYEGHGTAAIASLARARDTEISLHARITSILLEAAHLSRQQSPGRTRGLLDKSLQLAAPERMRRPFHEAPADIQRMLANDQQLASQSTWLTRGATTASASVPGSGTFRSAGSVSARTSVGLEADNLPAVIEPLTTKELEVLGHLAELLSTQEIAAAMFVSVNTVRTHVRNILRKLGVTRRSAAVRRARRLQIV
jgi:LuxR family transcriptional regulator, maltose regulon positive regulatory protein